MINIRLRFALGFFLLTSGLILVRLFYWQIISAGELAEMADVQHLSRVEIPAARGKIVTSDGFTLVGNAPAHLAYSYLPDIEADPRHIAEKLAPILYPDPEDPTASAKLIKTLIQDTESTISAKLSDSNFVWLPLARKISDEKKSQIESFNFKGIGFEPEQTRFYPEASMSAHLLGFVGSDINGNPKGYFGLEGFYNLELKGRPGIIRQEKDATGKPILVGDFGGYSSVNGRSLKVYLDRSVQRIVETELEEAIERYGAKSGEVVIMEPSTGGILASSSFPHYEPQKFTKYDSSLHKNPIVADSYEPGSTFKVLVMAAALDADAVEPDTECDICTGPITIGKYTIRTWDEKYRPNLTMTEVIQYSDNIGMIFVGQKLGKPDFYDYLTKFGIGESTGVDLQEETSPSLRSKTRWGDIDLATASFGQGIAVTAIQMATAVNVIANDGNLVKPQVVQQIIGDKIVDIPPKVVRTVVSKETADEITDMMVNSVESGEAQWTKIKGYKIAGKTGTAQIAVAGHYDEEKTIASYVGFAPADAPKFTMLVKLREPESSPWAAETAAPLWMNIARRLFLYYGVPPEG